MAAIEPSQVIAVRSTIHPIKVVENEGDFQVVIVRYNEVEVLKRVSKRSHNARGLAQLFKEGYARGMIAGMFEE